MSTINRVAIVCLALAMGAALTAQDKPAAPPQPAGVAPPQPGGPLASLKVQLVLSRYQGDKKISSMPYILQLTANERETTNLRMGTEVPVATGGGGYNYRSVGTNIDCRAQTTGDGSTYRLHVTVNDSSVRFQDREKTEGTPSAAIAAPAFRSFTANFVILLRDGQTSQYTSATDPASGEVLKVDATLNVLK